MVWSVQLAYLTCGNTEGKKERERVRKRERERIQLSRLLFRRREEKSTRW